MTNQNHFSFFNNESGAEFSECRKFRYSLWRTWVLGKGRLVFIGLNPSTADEYVDDPTIMRCKSFAKGFGFGSIIMLNLFAFRSTDPNILKQVEDPIGPQNDQYILEFCTASEKTIVAWGNHGHLLDRDTHVIDMLRKNGVPLWCLGTTRDGSPKHPLYLPRKTELSLFKPDGI